MGICHGYPETEKLLMIGNIYGVSMDYLLKESFVLVIVVDEYKKYGDVSYTAAGNGDYRIIKYIVHLKISPQD